MANLVEQIAAAKSGVESEFISLRDLKVCLDAFYKEIENTGTSQGILVILEKKGCITTEQRSFLVQGVESNEAAGLEIKNRPAVESFLGLRRGGSVTSRSTGGLLIACTHCSSKFKIKQLPKKVSKFKCGKCQKYFIVTEKMVNSRSPVQTTGLTAETEGKIIAHQGGTINLDGDQSKKLAAKAQAAKSKHTQEVPKDLSKEEPSQPSKKVLKVDIEEMFNDGAMFIGTNFETPMPPIPKDYDDGYETDDSPTRSNKTSVSSLAEEAALNFGKPKKSDSVGALADEAVLNFGKPKTPEKKPGSVGALADEAVLNFGKPKTPEKKPGSVGALADEAALNFGANFGKPKTPEKKPGSVGALADEAALNFGANFGKPKTPEKKPDSVGALADEAALNFGANFGKPKENNVMNNGGVNISSGGMTIPGSSGGVDISGGGMTIPGNSGGIDISGGGMTIPGDSGGIDISGGGMTIPGNSGSVDISGGGMTIPGNSGSVDISGGGMTIPGNSGSVDISGGGMTIPGDSGGIDISGGGMTIPGDSGGIDISGGGMTIPGDSGGIDISGGGMTIPGDSGGIDISGDGMTIPGDSGGIDISGGGMTISGSNGGVDISGSGMTIPGDSGGIDISGGGMTIPGSNGGVDISSGGMTIPGSSGGVDISSGGMTIPGSSGGVDISGGGMTIPGSSGGVDISGGGMTIPGSSGGVDISGDGMTIPADSGGIDISGSGMTIPGNNSGGIDISGGGMTIPGNNSGIDISNTNTVANNEQQDFSVAGLTMPNNFEIPSNPGDLLDLGFSTHEEDSSSSMGTIELDPGALKMAMEEKQAKEKEEAQQKRSLGQTTLSPKMAEAINNASALSIKESAFLVRHAMNFDYIDMDDMKEIVEEQQNTGNNFAVILLQKRYATTFQYENLRNNLVKDKQAGRLAKVKLETDDEVQRFFGLKENKALIRFSCPHCSTKYKVRINLKGGKFKCGTCKEYFFLKK
ncbi:MJ0042-type zinc finger domain-containing protein [Candidatus Uabimicrobium sp. HlEnr_7]|uniref:MJ0042-type zinc finger domain-containing protein n=1 Tax=Candidatus Uabimicrobium helgolandensis TaxID=3095367 RepID=UPI003557F353